MGLFKKDILEIILKSKITKLELKKGDIVVFKINYVLKDDAYLRLNETLKDYIPKKVKILLLESGCDLSIIQPRCEKKE